MKRSDEKRSDEKTEEMKFDHEKDIWFKFYQRFNDDNLSHCENAFFSNGLYSASAEEVRRSNMEWIEEIRAHHISDKDIIKYMPEAAEYM